MTADEAAPTPNWIRAEHQNMMRNLARRERERPTVQPMTATDEFGHVFRHSWCDKPVGSHGRECVTISDILRHAPEGSRERSALLAALGHTDCVPRSTSALHGLYGDLSDRVEYFKSALWQIVNMRNCHPYQLSANRLEPCDKKVLIGWCPYCYARKVLGEEQE